jgi:hypothetical protein
MIEIARKDSMGNKSLMAIVAKYFEPKGSLLDGM